MQLRNAVSGVMLFLAIGAAGPWSWAGDAPAKDKEPAGKADEPKKAAKEDEGLSEDVVAKVDTVLITRADLTLVRRQILAVNPNAQMPNNKQLVEQLIERVLWSRYFEKEGLRASGADIQRAIQQLDAELRQRGANYQRWIASRGLTAEEHAGMLAFELATARLRERLEGDVKEEDIKKEFEAHPEWYDGSRVRVSQIFIETADIQHDPDKLKKAEERIRKIYDELKAGKDFERMARDYSDGVASMRGGDRGWFTRKGAEEDEILMAAAWELKVGEYTKPIQGSRGWHIIKVTDREPARLTPFGARANVVNELIRRRATAILEELKAKTTIERRI